MPDTPQAAIFAWVEAGNVTPDRAELRDGVWSIIIGDAQVGIIDQEGVVHPFIDGDPRQEIAE